jgi:hypothetical protein
LTKLPNQVSGLAKPLPFHKSVFIKICHQRP